MGSHGAIRLDDEAFERFVQSAAENGRSLEEEVRAALATGRSRYVKDTAALLRLSDEALAMTPPGGPDGASDSTLLIRWDRDTNHGKWLDDGWADDDARR